MNPHQEICIAGGGPAGIATALTLLNRGVQCIVLEASEKPRSKVGETLPPNITPVLHALGIEKLLDPPEHIPCYGNSWLWGKQVEEKLFMMHAGGNGWHLQRSKFEADLMDLAEDKGVQIIRNAKLMQVSENQNGNWKLKVQIGHSEFEIESRFLVDATGRNSKIARCLNILRRRCDALVGVVARFKLGEDIVLSRQTHIEAVENGWWYAAALSNQEMVIAFMTDADLLSKEQQRINGFWQSLKETRLVSTLFPDDYQPDAATVLQTQSAETSFLESIHGQNWLAVGDAAFAYDPVSSYGITSGLGSGYYAGNAIADHLNGEAEALPAYRYLVEKAFADYLPMQQYQYGQEDRWPESLFWNRRKDH